MTFIINPYFIGKVSEDCYLFAIKGLVPEGLLCADIGTIIINLNNDSVLSNFDEYFSDYLPKEKRNILVKQCENHARKIAAFISK